MYNRSETCNGTSVIDSSEDKDILKCKELCDKQEKCKFFSINSNNRCNLHSSCTHIHRNNSTGSTFEKMIGKGVHIRYFYSTI